MKSCKKYESVYDLLEDPERWNRGSMAVDANGVDCPVGSEKAAKFCLAGAIARIYGSCKYDEIITKVAKHLDDEGSECDEETVTLYNDCTCHEDLLDLVKKAGI